MAFIWDMVMLVGLVGIGYWVMQNPDSIKNLLGDLKLPAGSGGGSIGAGAGGSGAISTSTTCDGTPLVQDTGNGREEWESKSTPGDAYEVTWCGTFSTDELTFKMYGPSHSSAGDCCWCVMHVYPDGKMVAGGEGPHPSSNCEHASSSKGGSGKATCYKATIEPGPIQKGYALVNGKWELRAEYKGPCGCDETSSVKSGDTLMVRNDGDAKTTCASVKALGSASTGAGASAPAATATTAASDSGDEEEEEEESNYTMAYYGGRQRLYRKQEEVNKLMPKRRVNSLGVPKFTLS